MTGLWNPEFWNGLGVVSVVVIVAVAFVVGLTRGWIVPGKYHREMLDAKDRELAARDKQIDRFQARDDEQSSTIAILAKSNMETASVQGATTRILSALRDTLGGDS